MSKTNTGGPAFPQVSTDQNGDLYQPGLSVRDYFAAMALHALLRHDKYVTHTNVTTQRAYGLADAMLKAREA